MRLRKNNSCIDTMIFEFILMNDVESIININPRLTRYPLCNF